MRESQRQANIRWRQAHRELYNEQQRGYSYAYWFANKEKCSLIKKKEYQYKKECKRLCNILF
jgi:hypothetical protein